MDPRHTFRRGLACVYTAKENRPGSTSTVRRTAAARTRDESRIRAFGSSEGGWLLVPHQATFTLFDHGS